MADFRLWTDEFPANGFMPKAQEYKHEGFGVDGSNRSPALHWEGVPADAKSLALTVYDPDAPTGSGFWHWAVVNIPVDTAGLPQDAGAAGSAALPAGAVQVRNDYGDEGFGGAAPPRGDKPHRYIFRLHALKVDSLPITKETTNAVARFMIHLNEIDSATYTGLYELKELK
ncbi:YbhB/YbcL family Raf kinase inhibitor-like protein [Burkholderia pseudomallei]|uniref:YbhB/YbcL family Raf kinase inhibitor-like protein n=1 Tax=Burkholderia pseudomallei TaxID=28450 RepID=UPI000977B269|nr:YbhB/YbcL family Raf kinase inhibitor-like protein [Burkholderia pseudomallei]ONA19634.1 kinase inhibitor [Burkholderia pseudomallei]